MKKHPVIKYILILIISGSMRQRWLLGFYEF